MTGDRDHHDHEHPEEHLDELLDLSDLVEDARSGLRSDVQNLVDAFTQGELFVPLAEDIPDAPEGQRVEVEDELTFRPHMVIDDEGHMYSVAYTRPEFAEAMQEHLGWTTDGGDLKFCSVPARFVLEMALSVIDEEEVFGLVLNAGSDGELVLRRDEVGSMMQGHAVPLVGYIDDLSEVADEDTIVVEGADPPPAALLEALRAAQEQQEGLADFEVATTFNPERDREPHPTITLVLADSSVDRRSLAEAVMSTVSQHLPPPGYADVVFRDPKTES